MREMGDSIGPFIAHTSFIGIILVDLEEREDVANVGTIGA